MAIGTTAALIGSAVIGAGASALSASSTNKQIKKASNQTAADNAASRALQEKIYNQNNALLSPYNERGNVAGDTINALLGLPAAGSSGTAEPDYSAYVMANPDLLAEYKRIGGEQFGNLNDYGKFHWDRYGQSESRSLPNTGVSGGSGVTPESASSAFDNFRNSTGYQFRFDEGMKGLNALNLARGSADSGAAVKSALRYGQDYGSNEFGNFLGYLGNQQGVGLSGASAVAGVGQSYANNMTNLNSQNSANAWNTAQAKSQSNNSLYGGLASSFGTALGGASRFGSPTGAYGISGSGGIY